MSLSTARAALLDAHVEFELAQWTGAGLRTAISAEIEVLYAWLGTVTLADLAPAQSTAATLARLLEQITLTDGTATLVTEIVDVALEALREDGLTLEELIHPDDALVFAGSAGRNERLRTEVIGALTSSTAYRRLVAHVLYRGVKAYVLTENVFARRIPGASSLVKFGQRSLNTAAPGLEQAVDSQLSAFVEANIAETLRESRRYLEATVDEAMVRSVAQEAWDAVAARPLADLGDLIEDDEFADLTGHTVAVVQSVLESGRLTPVIEAGLADLLERYAEESPADLLTDLGLSAEDVRGPLITLAEQAMALPEIRAVVESRIRARLTAFYASPAAAAIT